MENLRWANLSAHRRIAFGGKNSARGLMKQGAGIGRTDAGHQRAESAEKVSPRHLCGDG